MIGAQNNNTVGSKFALYAADQGFIPYRQFSVMPVVRAKSNY